MGEPFHGQRPEFIPNEFSRQVPIAATTKATVLPTWEPEPRQGDGEAKNQSQCVRKNDNSYRCEWLLHDVALPNVNLTPHRRRAVPEFQTEMADIGQITASCPFELPVQLRPQAL